MTASRSGSATAADSCGLLIDADLTVDLPETTLQLHSEADTLYVDAPDFAALRSVRRIASNEALAWLHRRGIESPLAVDTPIVVRVCGVPVARYERAVSPGRLADWLGVPFQIDLRGVLRAALRRTRS
ncbi:MAG: hypothetical protein ACOC0Z_07680 [Halohasta sp.]